MERVWLVCDVSGSMAEGGKRLAARGLIRQVEQFFRFGYARRVDLRLATWSCDVKEFDWKVDEEVPAELLDCGGSSDVGSLELFFDTHSDSRFLVFTDAGWRSVDERLMCDVRERLGANRLRFLKVGHDDTRGLRGSDTYDAERLMELLDDWFE